MVADTEDVYSMPASSSVSITKKNKINNKFSYFTALISLNNITTMIFIDTRELMEEIMLRMIHIIT